jgi:dipeptidyl aminopeptidase/acylaminoacyl peptidase
VTEAPNALLPEAFEPAVAPYGSWSSPIRVDDVVGDIIGLGEPWIDGDDVYWLEARPSEGGRRVLVRCGIDGVVADVVPANHNVRTRVHEYGGGSYTVHGGVVVFSEFKDGRLYRLDPGASEAVPITPEGPWRYADMRADPGRRRFLSIREDHGVEGQPEAAIVAVPLDGTEPPAVLYKGPDFIAAPRLSPDGRRLAWLEWEHPDMPWDATRLRVAPLGDDGTVGISALVAGGPDESIVQPEWSPDGVIHFVSDRSGWWNLYRIEAGPTLQALAPMAAEFADPAWVFGRSSYAFAEDGSIAAVARFDGRDHLMHVEPDEFAGEVVSPYTEFEGFVAGRPGIVSIAGSPGEPTVVARLDRSTLAVAGVLRRASGLAVEPELVSIPETIHFPTTGGRTAHALYSPPRNPRFRGPEGERPPLMVLSHGGPTSNTSTALDLTKELLTSRGFAVVDVDYGGSSGYGRDFRRQLNGAWGVVDVDDCVAAAEYLVARGDVDPDRLAIQGGSAGGYTTLAALAFRDVFGAGVTRFGVGDLETMARDTHKFESRYLDRLVGPYPEAAELYRQRSPVHFLDRIACPVLVMQGLDDRVVPPSQAEAIVDALAANGIPHAYLAFEGEGHGFRGAAAIRRSLEAELSFLAQVFGYEPADQLEPVDLPGLAAWRRTHARRTRSGPTHSRPTDEGAAAASGGPPRASAAARPGG